MKDINIDKILAEVDSLVSAGSVAEGVERLTDVVQSVDNEVMSADEKKQLAEIYFRRGKLLWRMSRRAEAQSDYGRALSLDPQSRAALALEQAREVAAFFNPDLYNP